MQCAFTGMKVFSSVESVTVGPAGEVVGGKAERSLFPGT